MFIMKVYAQPRGGNRGTARTGGNTRQLNGRAAQLQANERAMGGRRNFM